MRSNRVDHDCPRLGAPFLATALAVVSLCIGCAGPRSLIQMEPLAVSGHFGLSGCQVSVPISEVQIIEIGRRWELYPDPRKDPEWIKLQAIKLEGDEFRLVDCGAEMTNFYALVRSGKVIGKYYPLTLE